MNILSLFDGISVGYLALKRAGIRVDQYVASEIDKYAIKISKKNFPDIIHIGSVEEIDVNALPKIDLLIGGSPCQGFSSAGKKLNFEDPRSKLFFEFVRIKNELTDRNPDLLFLLENVKMKREWENLISHYMGIHPVEINSALVSAQTRKRLYWTNIRTRKYSMFGDLISDIPQPEDRGIYLKDIIENGYTERDKSLMVSTQENKTSHHSPDRYLRKKSRQIIWKNKRVADKYYLSEKVRKNIKEAPQRGSLLPKINPDKVSPLDTANNAAQLRLNAGTSLILLDTRGNLKKNQGKVGCLTAGGNSAGNHSDMDILYEEGPRTGEFFEGKLSATPEEKK